MSRALAVLVLALLVVPTVAAQMVVRAPDGFSTGRPMESAVHVDIRFETKEKQAVPLQNPWLVVGHDNVLNLTVRNGLAEPLNATFRFNVSGASVTPAEITFSLEPQHAEGYSFVIHPEDVGMVEIVAEAIDSFQASGEPHRALLAAPALLLPSMRFLDPPLPPETSEDDEFLKIDPFRGGHHGGGAYLRMRPGESLAPRVELTNPYESSIAGFRLRLQVPGRELTPVEVPPIESGDTFVAEFEEFTPVEQSFGNHYYGGPMGNFELRPVAETAIGGAQAGGGGIAFRIDRGAVVDIEPAVAIVIVQDGLAVDLFVPREPVLGVPARIMYELTNMQTTPAQGRLTLQVMTPGSHFYEVQGPETHQVPVDLAPGEVSTGTITITPRVTGVWQVSTTFRSAQGFGYGGGGPFEVDGPLVIAFERTDQVFARIGEPVEIGLSVGSAETIQDAQLRVTSGSQYYRDPSGMSGSDYRPGFVDSLIESRSPTSSLGTLRPGGIVNASVEVTARSSGYYNIVPYVLAEGFAYTSTIPRDESGVPLPLDMPFGANMLNFVVQPRAVPPGLSLAPLTLGLAFFVGAWTLRTRFVR